MAGPLVRDALEAYHRAQGLAGDAVHARVARIRVLGLAVDVPSPSFQRPLLARHDLHHVLTGYDTSLAGEAEVGAWELGAGPGHPFVWLNNLGALLLAVGAPRRAWRAYRRGRRCRSLYLDPLAYDALLAMDLTALRARVGLHTSRKGTRCE
ncbi:MAG: hypothetical protein ACFCGT_15630 [Sandaracinaceae bacterium]